MMKKQLITIFLATNFFVVFGQNNKVVSAWNYLNYNELDNAKEAIDAAALNEQTSGKAKTWYYRGMVYHQIFESDKPEFQKLDPNAISVAVTSYAKALSLPDVNRIDKDQLTSNYFRAGNQLINQGIARFNDKNYQDAVKNFEQAIGVSNYFKAVDSLSHYYAGFSYKRMEQYDKAETYFKKCIDINYQGPLAYANLADIYLAQNKKDEYKTIIKEGRTKFPDDAGLLTQEINIYLEEEDVVGALTSLNIAIEKDLANKTLYFARGNMYEKQSEALKTTDLAKSIEYYNNAELDYKKAIEIDANYFDATYNLGAMIFNKGVAEMDVINEIKDFKKYEVEKKKADEIFKLSLPYLEKAHEIDPKDKGVLISLKDLYVRLNQTDKYNEVKEKLDKL
jgi:tetratricopeptide (TPR) repeat protein